MAERDKDQKTHTTTRNEGLLSLLSRSSVLAQKVRREGLEVRRLRINRCMAEELRCYESDLFDELQARGELFDTDLPIYYTKHPRLPFYIDTSQEEDIRLEVVGERDPRFISLEEARSYMRLCDRCRVLVYREDRFCHNCGAPVPHEYQWDECQRDGE